MSSGAIILPCYVLGWTNRACRRAAIVVQCPGVALFHCSLSLPGVAPVLGPPRAAFASLPDIRRLLIYKHKHTYNILTAADCQDRRLALGPASQFLSKLRGALPLAAQRHHLYRLDCKFILSLSTVEAVDHDTVFSS